MDIRVPDAFPELESLNLRLRQLRPSDGEALLRIFSDAEVTQYYDLEILTGIGQALALIEEQNTRFRQGDGLRWGLTQKANNVVIGTVGLVFTKSNAQGGLGYDLARPYWRRGIMSEALAIVIRYAFLTLNVNRLQGLVMPGNVASARLLGKLGFQEEGILRQYAFFKGRFQDLRCFSLLKEEFLAQKG